VLLPAVRTIAAMVARAAAVSRHPAQVVVIAFFAATLIGTLLLLMPFASDGDTRPGFTDSLFTSTSAVTVTGLQTVSIADWSRFGEVVILVLIQVGGFGIMTIGALFTLVAMRRMGLRHRMLSQAEMGSVPLGDMRRLIGGIARLTIGIEATVAIVLTLRLWASEAEPSVLRALYSGVFHAVSSFNNAGVSLYRDNLTRFASDTIVLLVVSVAIILGGLGFPIMMEIRRCLQPSRWSLHTRLTLTATAALLIVGTVIVVSFEWTNPDTLGSMDLQGKLLNGWFQGVSPRTAGFNTVDYAAMEEPTLLATTALMFIGAGPASTSGGIKVTTFALLGWVLWSELRGEADVNVMGRRISSAVIRQAIAIVLMAIAVVLFTALGLLAVADLDAMNALFEATSAFGTVGLSTGVTAGLPLAGQLLLIALMFAGRVGPVTLATALVLRDRRRLYRNAEEHPILG
jgi:trk system potassium uptake protein